ncbi:MAG: IclR family transcriptional regulator [Bacteroidia bacterium]|nr:IclR family transcriptional regulator [Bacteroidia bacterium]
MSLPSEPKTFNNSIAKAFALLEEFSPQKSSWGVRELAQKLNANQSTTYRLMATLEGLGVLKKDPLTDKYSLGLKLFELGQRVSIHEAFVSKTHPILEKVAEEITETVHLGIFRQNKVFMVDKVESPMGLKLSSTTGAFSPAYCTSIGKMLLAYLSESELREFMDSTELTPKTDFTISSSAALLKELKEIKTQGYSIDRQEFELGLTCVGVPVFNQLGQQVAALSAAGPEMRFREEALDEYVGILTRGAEAIKHKIGSFHP